MQDYFRPAAAAMISDLSACRGDEAAEQAALHKALDACVAAAVAQGDDTPLGELMIPEQFSEDAYEGDASVLESVPDATEDDVSRWREAIADLCGY